MSERFFRKQVYQLGMFYQVNSSNPIFLDKTGELISKTEGKLKNWNGGIEGFQFSDDSELISGKVNMDSYWYHYQKQGDFDDDSLGTFSKFVSETNEIISNVYQPTNFSRMGMRLQFILKKTSASVKEKYKHHFDTGFSSLKKYGVLSTAAIGFDIDNGEYNIKVNVNYARRQTDIDKNAPKDGLLFDLDFSKSLNKIKLDGFTSLNKKFLAHVSSNYKDIICCIAQEMGAINEG